MSIQAASRIGKAVPPTGSCEGATHLVQQDLAEDRTRKAAEAIMSASLGQLAATIVKYAASTAE